MDEDDENLINNRKQKKQLLVFSKKIEEIISEYKNRKKFGLPKIEEDNLQKVDIQQYNDFFEQMEEHKNKVNAYKLKLNNDDKFIEITKKEDDLKYLINQFKTKEKEYKYLTESNKKLNGFQNNILEEEIKYYNDELKKLKSDISIKNKEYLKYNDDIKNIRKDISNLEKDYDLIHKNIEFKKFEMAFIKNVKVNNNEDTNEVLEIEMQSSKNQVNNLNNEYNKKRKEKELLENEIIELTNKLEKYKYDAHLNELKMKEIQKIENQIKINKNKENNKMNNLKKIEDNNKKIKAKNMKNLMAESFKNNFPFKNNYKLILEEEKKQRNHLVDKPKLEIAKNKMKSSFSSMDIFNTKREDMKRKKEMEKIDFMNNLDKELKEYEEQKGKTREEIITMRDDIQKYLESVKVQDDIIDNIKK